MISYLGQYWSKIHQKEKQMKRTAIAILIITISLASCKTLGDLGIKPSGLETVMALKKILDSSTFRAIKTLKNMNDGGIETNIPSEVATVLNTLKTIGYKDEIDQVTKSIGSASSLVLGESESIISDAISELKFTDAVSVVLGGEDAATNVLKRAMYETVKKRYSTRLESELSKTDALTYWPLAAGAYNIFASNKIDGSLSDFMAERAVDGLFIAIGKQEAQARTNYKEIGSSVVTKVFDYYKGKEQKKS